jgi:hypothetical protein
MRGLIVTLTALGLVPSLLLAPTAIAGGRSPGGFVRAGGSGFLVVRPAIAPDFAQSSLVGSIVGSYPGARPVLTPFTPFPRTRFFGRFTTFAAPVLYGAPAMVYEPLAYADPPALYAPPPSASASIIPSPPPAPEVIRYSDGRYELRGDGISTPYRWVWIPNAPPPPKSGRENPLYGWTDEKGVLHVTDRWESVPQRYRAEAKRNQTS